MTMNTKLKSLDTPFTADRLNSGFHFKGTIAEGNPVKSKNPACPLWDTPVAKDAGR